MTVQNPALFLPSPELHPAEDLRRYVATVAADREGVVELGGLEVTERAGTPVIGIDVAAGRAFIQGDEQTYQGTYFVENRGITELAVAAADATNPRKDLVVARVRDSQYSGSTRAWALELVTGTAADPAVEPDVPDNAIVLALIDVPAAAPTITNSEITDRRTWFNTRPRWSTSRTTNQAITDQATGSWQPLTFNQADTVDTDAFHSTSVNPTRFTIPTGLDGSFTLKALVEWASNTSGSRGIRFLKNGAALLDQSLLAATTTAGRYQLSLDVEVVAGDYFEVQVWQSSGASLNVARSTCQGLYNGR